MSAATSDHDTPSRSQISELADPLGWRLVLGVLITHVPVPSLAAAADAAGVAVAAATPDAEGHLSADLHADRLVLRLQTRAVGAITGRDLRMASQISAAASGRGWHTLPGDAAAVPQLLEIAIDAMDIAAIRPFWQAVTGYLDEPAAPELPNALVDPLRRGPAIWFQQMETPRPQRNRIHLDVDVAAELAQARVAAALAAGGALLSAAAAPSFWVLADPEGNEACVCTWQGRD
ncbi:VOC family protein [soil metagenome]